MITAEPPATDRRILLREGDRLVPGRLKAMLPERRLALVSRGETPGPGQWVCADDVQEIAA